MNHEPRWLVGVSTSSSPPSSSSYAGKMSATALRGRSPSALTATGFPWTLTSHSSAVPTWSVPSSKRRPSTSLTGRPIACSIFRPVAAEGAPTAVDDPPFAVAGEESRVWRRVIIVEQLKQIREPALVAAASLAPGSGVAVDAQLPVPAVGADEIVLVRHFSRRLRIASAGASAPSPRLALHRLGSISLTVPMRPGRSQTPPGRARMGRNLRWVAILI